MAKLENIEESQVKHIGDYNNFCNVAHQTDEFQFKVFLVNNAHLDRKTDPDVVEVRRFISQVVDGPGAFAVVCARLEEFLTVLQGKTYSVFWRDEDNDFIAVSTDSEMAHAITIMHASSQLVKLYAVLNTIKTQIHIGNEDTITHAKAELTPNTKIDPISLAHKEDPTADLPPDDAARKKVRNPPKSIHTLILGSSLLRGLKFFFKYSEAFIMCRTGATIQSLHDEIQLWEANTKISSIMLLAGDQDLANSQDVAEVTNNISSLLQLLETKFPNAKLYVNGVIRRDQTAKSLTFELNKRLSEQYKDPTKIIFSDPNRALKDEHFAKDGIHFNSEGKEALAQYIREILPQNEKFSQPTKNGPPSKLKAKKQKHSKHITETQTTPQEPMQHSHKHECCCQGSSQHIPRYHPYALPSPAQPRSPSDLDHIQNRVVRNQAHSSQAGSLSPPATQRGYQRDREARHSTENTRFDAANRMPLLPTPSRHLRPPHTETRSTFPYPSLRR